MRNQIHCPQCTKRYLKVYEDHYYCRLCKHTWPKCPKKAGSGVIAGPTYRQKLAREGLGRE